VIEGAGPDAPTIYNEHGAGQSDIPYRFDLIDAHAIASIAKVLKNGADKYGANNWRKIEVEDHLNHLIMHAYAYLAGDKTDDHLAHIGCRAIFALGVSL
jgi:dATP/dGTP diphosphohydrolase, N-terminal